MEKKNKELFLACVVMLFIPLLAEVVLRVSVVRFQSQLYRADYQLGWALRQGARGFVNDENAQSVQINSHGFHDFERSFEKPDGTVRIAVLGNSWTEALQVPLGKAYTSIMEHSLSEAGCFPGKRVEVLNFGVSGYSTAQEYMLLKQEVWKYHPDIVVLAFYSARDIANNVREFNNAASPEQSPYFVYRGQNLVLDASYRDAPAVQKRQIMLQNIRGAVTEHILLLQAINAAVRFTRTQMALAQIRKRDEKSGAISLEHSIYAPPPTAGLQTAWNVTEGLLVAMRDEVRSHGADFRIVTLANRPQVIPDPGKRSEFMKSIGVSNLSYADERIKSLGDRASISVSTLATPLSSYSEAHQVYLNGFNSLNIGSGHWNETGHQVAGEAIAESICHSENKKPWLSAVAPR